MTKASTTTSRQKANLIDRQRRLWSHAEAIQLAQSRGQPLPPEVSEWLHRALKQIACGMDANEAFDVVSGRKGLRRDGFLAEMNQKIANGLIAASKESFPERTVAEAQELLSMGAPKTKQSTIRKNWNRATTARKPTFTLGKK